MIFEQNLELSKVAVLLSRWQSGSGDYLKLREELFKDETVESLGEQIVVVEVQCSQEELD